MKLNTEDIRYRFRDDSGYNWTVECTNLGVDRNDKFFRVHHRYNVLIRREFLGKNTREWEGRITTKPSEKYVRDMIEVVLKQWAKEDSEPKNEVV
jgi:hypothetical protein